MKEQTTSNYDRAIELKNWLIKVRRDFHQYPELGMEEWRTSKKIAEYLNEMGIEYQSGIANTGIVGIIRGDKPGRTVALRADMDALPIKDAKNVPYKSKVDGKMHACGHDAHTTILLGAAKILNEMKENLKGNVKLIFQPAEETVGGAKQMIDDGTLENPRVDAIFGLHVDANVPVGKVGIKYGKRNASSDMININIYGKGAHGAWPHNGFDAIAAAAQIICTLQTVVSRNTNPLDSAVVTIGTIKGGNGGNIIADKVEMVGIIRTLNPAIRLSVLERVKNIVEGIPKAMGLVGEFIRHESYPALINNDEYVDIVKLSTIKLLGEDSVEIIQDAEMGVEDFSYFLEQVPGAFYNLGCRNEKNGIVNGAHNALFDIDEDCLAIGTELQVENVLSILNGE